MPIVRSLQQKNKTLEEFYTDIKNHSHPLDKKIGQGMLDFIAMINDTFIQTTLYGLTSDYSLYISPSDELEEKNHIKVYGDLDEFNFEYKIPDDNSPWKDACIKAQANSIAEAKELLLIAMIESMIWIQNKEVRKLYNKIKKIKTNQPSFSLWLEFEEVDFENWDIKNEFCNIQVSLDDGRKYGINVWTYNFFETVIKNNTLTKENLNGLYIIPPDLFVKELTRDCIQKTIEDLLKTDDLDKVLNPSIITR